MKLQVGFLGTLQQQELGICCTSWRRLINHSHFFNTPLPTSLANAFEWGASSAPYALGRGFPEWA